MSDSLAIKALLAYIADGARALGRIKREDEGKSVFTFDLGFLGELLFQRVVDNFITFISELLASILEARPEMLISEGAISVKEVLEYETKSELVKMLTERKVLALSFKGLRELNEEMRKKYEFALFNDAASLDTAAELVEKRNLIAHNRAIVNQRYRDRVPAATEQIGEKLAMSTQSMVDAHTFFTRAMARIQTEAANKFFLANVSPTIVVGGR